MLLENCSGEDDWTYFEDSCHVNVRAQKLIHDIGFVICVLGSSIMLMSICFEKYKKRAAGTVYNPLVLKVLVAFFSYGALATIYLGGFAFGLSRRSSADGALLLDIAVGLYMPVASCYTISCFHSLILSLIPDVKRYGSLLGINTYLVKNPNTVTSYTKLTAFLSPIAFSLAVVAPRINEDHRVTYDMVLLGMFTVVAMIGIIHFWLLAKECRKIYKLALVTFDDFETMRGSSSEQKADERAFIKRGYKKSNTWMTVVSIIGVNSTAVLLISLFAGLKYIYITFSMFLLIGVTHVAFISCVTAILSP